MSAPLCPQCRAAYLKPVPIFTPGTALREYRLDCAGCRYIFQPLNASGLRDVYRRFRAHLARVKQ